MDPLGKVKRKPYQLKQKLCAHTIATPYGYSARSERLRRKDPSRKPHILFIISAQNFETLIKLRKGQPQLRVPPIPNLYRRLGFPFSVSLHHPPPTLNFTRNLGRSQSRLAINGAIQATLGFPKIPLKTWVLHGQSSIVWGFPISNPYRI